MFVCSLCHQLFSVGDPDEVGISLEDELAHIMEDDGDQVEASEAEALPREAHLGQPYSMNKL